MGWGRMAVAALGACAASEGFSFVPVSLWGSPKEWVTVRRRRPGKRKPWRVVKGSQGKVGRRAGRGGKR